MQVFRTQRRVEFRDTDAAGIAHFSVFFVLMEQVEHELLRARGLSVMLSDAEGTISWPRVAARCDYTSAVHFEDILDITAAVSRLGTKSVTYDFHFHCADRPVAHGQITAVCCRFDAAGKPVAIAIPDWIAAKLAPQP